MTLKLETYSRGLGIGLGHGLGNGYAYSVAAAWFGTTLLVVGIAAVLVGVTGYMIRRKVKS